MLECLGLLFLVLICIWLAPFLIAGAGIALCLTMALICWVKEQLTNGKPNQ